MDNKKKRSRIMTLYAENSKWNNKIHAHTHTHAIFYDNKKEEE